MCSAPSCPASPLFFQSTFVPQESLRLAKEALKMDIGCGNSWYALGNAYVASFFGSSRGIKDLDRALQAYKKAVRLDSHVLSWLRFLVVLSPHRSRVGAGEHPSRKLAAC